MFSISFFFFHETNFGFALDAVGGDVTNSVFDTELNLVIHVCFKQEEHLFPIQVTIRNLATVVCV